MQTSFLASLSPALRAILSKPGKSKWAICPCCDGNGRVENSAFSNGFSSDEWSEMCHDRDDFDGTSMADRYLSGAYDVACSECASAGKVRVADVSALTFAERRVLATERREERETARFHAEIAAEYDAERAMGA